ncbi:uncharacterized protein N0V89_010456 [Didymosphaeria variabile]|uniref:Uncharacterized protein n=1 Tax=Didymosphaeria variabile TaxID=1932322 RepID=A0A9W8XBN9_9PLEO|nr:uncharacterized protein N0V89_010456 [Didymosphaeria variabile]KAJ4346525.1 hypothetical protein N0V89_010456 [Didymosphaeria variabile]
MRHNISINGVDVIARGDMDENGDFAEAKDVGEEVVIEEFEAFDEKLRKRVGGWLSGGIGLLRRLAGIGGRRGRRRRGGGRRSGEGEELERARVVGLEDGEVDVGGVEALKRQEEVEKNWGRAVEGWAL